MITQMAEISQKMLRESLDAFSRRDVELAKQVLKQDEEEDRLKAQALSSLIDLLKKDPAHSSQYVDLILLSRNMERIGDHATNVAEDVIFMVLGQDIRHHLSDINPV
jgi:phosphate transport system protein